MSDNDYTMVSTTEGIEVNDKGYVTNRPATVVHAMQDARHVAEEMLRYLDAVKLLEAIDSQA